MIELNARVLSPQAYALGEGIVWDDRDGDLWWVDALAGDIYNAAFDGTTVSTPERIHIDSTVGAICLADSDELIVAGNKQVWLVERDGSHPRPGPPLPVDLDGRRLNDAACDPVGRFLVGSVSVSEPKEGNSLMTVAATERARVLRKDVAVSNGLAWSPAGSTLYFIDSRPGIVWMCDYEARTGEASGWREGFRITDGTPDGLTVDADGSLWIALWGAGQVRRYAPSGEIQTIAHVDAPHTSCPVLAGPEMRTLVISTARYGLGPEELERWPDSGKLFACEVTQRGLPRNRWRPVPNWT
jgi:sugar lactone lactonase YvrE